MLEIDAIAQIRVRRRRGGTGISDGIQYLKAITCTIKARGESNMTPSITGQQAKADFQGSVPRKIKKVTIPTRVAT